MAQVIGIVGPTASGKGVLAKALIERGFSYYSLSERIREKCDAVGLYHTRENLQNVGDLLRQEFGCSVLAEWTSELFGDSQKIVVESIRHPEEVKFLTKYFGAKIVAVAATRFNRFKYMQIRGREGDPKVWEEFLAQDIREHSPVYPYSINIPGCVSGADHLIRNNSTKVNLLRNINTKLGIIISEGSIKKEREF